MAVNQWGPVYTNTGTSSINPWGYAVPGVNNPNNPNVAQTVPSAPPQANKSKAH